MARLAVRNGIPASELIAFADGNAANAFLRNNRNSTQAVLHTRAAVNATTGLLTGLEIAVQYNETVQSLLRPGTSITPGSWDPAGELAPWITIEAQQAAAAVLYEDAGVVGSGVEVRVTPFAKPPQVSSDIVGSAGALFFFSAAVFNFVIQSAAQRAGPAAGSLLG